jgi:hypothetical protein
LCFCCIGLVIFPMMKVRRLSRRKLWNLPLHYSRANNPLNEYFARGEFIRYAASVVNNPRLSGGGDQLLESWSFAGSGRNSSVITQKEIFTQKGYDVVVLVGEGNMGCDG